MRVRVPADVAPCRRIHTQARAHKQSTIMESEGTRDGMIKEAEGEAQVGQQSVACDGCDV